MRALQRLRVPTLIFVNKIDRRGARRRAACCEDDRRAADAGRSSPMGAVRRTSAPATARLHAVRRGRRRPSAPRLAECSPSTTTRCWPRTSTTRRPSPYQRLRRAARGADPASAGASGLLRLGDHRRGRRGADGRHRRPAARRRTATRRRRSGHRLQGRARPGRREDRLRAAVLGTVRDARPAAARRGRRRAEGHRASSVFDSGAGRPRASVAAGQIGKLWGLGDVRIGDALGAAPHAGGASGHHFAPPTLETVVVPRARADDGRAARGARPARRAGPADQSAAGRHRRELSRLALRRGAEGGHPGDAGDRLRHRGRRSARRRRSASSGRSAPARPSSSSGQATTRSSPPSACASSRRRSDRRSSSGWRSSSRRSDVRLQGVDFTAVEDTRARDAAPGPATAGRSPTAWSP